MDKPKIIFIDLDGTALDGSAAKIWQKRPTQKTINTVKELNKQIPIVVSTGRGVNSKTEEIIKQLQLPLNYIAWNGAQIIQDGKIIHQEAIDAKTMQELFTDIAKDFDYVVLNSDGTNSSYVKNKMLRYFMGYGGKGHAQKFSSFQNNFDIYKALVWNFSTKKTHKLGKILQEKYKGKLNITFAGEHNELLEITSPKCSKGEAEVKYCASVNVVPKDAMHIGDTMNDASTKGKVGTLVAMQNAVEDLKQVADIITPISCDEAGLAQFLEQFLDK
ncbi:HAD-IIB family hydrolase [Mycoplasma seminis]|uniref:HAD-IIB family hydrolase n=1 Tax=Mycoplasma seminis TaxID=512749 RepID=A0ABY9HAA5_9MOLU|nr:HAD-IIB family hydrolase [Mycoplasma seminis]WLP85258.1 HAD-IIB family hydrolase [Mycoplasma seminis]